MKRKAKTDNARKRNEMRCPYCGAPVVLKSADGIYRDNSKNTMLYVCARYPACDAYVRTHPGTAIPVGGWRTATCERSAGRPIATLTSCTSPGI